MYPLTKLKDWFLALGSLDVLLDGKPGKTGKYVLNSSSSSISRPIRGPSDSGAGDLFQL